MSQLRCFVIMPFREEFDLVFASVREAVQSAVSDKSIECYWLKDVHAAGRITDDILQSLDGATLTVADVTGSNPNVMWETGFAMALGKPTILIGQGIDDLPFDLKTHRVIGYSRSNLSDFQSRLSEAVRQTLARYKLNVAPLPATGRRAPACIAVTGCFEGDAERIQSRLNELLIPFTGSGVTWLCGGAGDVDEAALKFLAAAKEQVHVVVNHPIDMTDAVRNFVEQQGTPVIDASIELLPKGFSGPSEREILICTRADLVILLWNGRSPLIGKLSKYFQSREKSVLLTMI